MSTPSDKRSRNARQHGPLGLLSWSSLGFALQGVGQLVVLAVLARYLTAEEFGVATAARIVIGLGQIGTLSLVIPAIVQRAELTPAHVRSGFALSLRGAVVATVLGCALAGPTASLFRMPALEPVMMALSVVFLLQAPGAVPQALLQRELQMRPLALAETVSFALAYVPVGVVMGVQGFGVWALVGAEVAQVVTKSAALVWQRPHERSLRLDREATRHLMVFAGGMMSARLCSYTASQADRVVVARWMTAGDLGIYGRAYQLMSMPAMFLGEVLDRVLFPLMARRQHDRDGLCAVYGRGISLISSVMTPAAVACVILGPEIVGFVLGDDWTSVTLPFQILSIALVWRTGYKISDSLARATGKVYARAWRQLLFAGLVFAGAAAGLPWSVAGVAVGVSAAILANYLMMAWLSLGVTGMSWSRFAALHGRGLALGAALGLGAWPLAAFLRALDFGEGPVLLVAGTVPVALLGLLAWRDPGRVLGRDGLWLIEKLTGRRLGTP